MRIPQYESIPCWHEISLKDSRTLVFSVLRTALAQAGAEIDWTIAPIPSTLIEKFRVDAFVPPREGAWGFGNVFSLAESNNPDWVRWELPLPVYKSSGRRNENEVRQALNIRCSLYMFSLVFTYIYDSLDTTSSDREQLLIIDHICLPINDRDFANGSLSCIVTPSTSAWLRKQTDSHLVVVAEAMADAYQSMWPGDLHGERFGARRQGRFIFLQVPGDACDLSPDNCQDDSLDEGYILVPHNTDTGLQQLAFVAGLAKLHDLIREGEKSR